MFIRRKVNNKPRLSKPVIQEVVPQEQPLEEPSIAEVALQKVEEILTMVPEVVENVAEPEQIAEEPIEEEAPAEETIPDLLDCDDEEGE